jgi:hypothetical protein
VTVRYVPASGSPSANGTALATQISAAVLGDAITLDAGGVYQGNLTLPGKGAGTSPITIGPGNAGGLFALPTRRFTPADTALCARLETNTTGAVLTFSPTSHHWVLQGLNITTTSVPFDTGSEAPNLVQDDGAITFTDHPNHITFDRCLLHPLEEDPILHRGASHGITINGSDITIIRSSIYNFTGWSPPQPTGQTIADATSANPVVVTFSSGHGIPVGQKRLRSFKGGTGSWTGINNTKLCEYVDATRAKLEDYDAATMVILTPVNGLGWPSFTSPAQSVIVTTMASSSNMALQVIAGPGPYVVEDSFLEAVYTPMFAGGGGSIIDPLNLVTVTSAANPLGTVTLSGVGAGGSNPLQIGDLIAFKTAEPQTVSAATTSPDSSTPCRITVAPHWFVPVGGVIGIAERGVCMSGATGAWTVLNNDFDGFPGWSNALYGKVISNTQIDLYRDRAQTVPFTTVGLSQPMTGTVKWVPGSPGPYDPDKHWQIGKVTNIVGNVVTYVFQGHTAGYVGNGAGVPIKQGSIAQFNGVVPSGFTIKHSTLGLRRSWIMAMKHACGTFENATDQGAKAIWEAKSANDVLIEGNIIECAGGVTTVNGYHFAGPVGIGMNQTSQSGDTPWTECSNWVIKNNIFKGMGLTKLSMQEEYFSGGTSTGFVFENNLCTPANVSFFSFEGTNDARVEHNTARNQGAGAIGLNFYVGTTHPNTNSVFRNNVGNFVLYGYNIESGSWVTPTVAKNYIINSHSVVGAAGYPGSTDVIVTDDAAMLFVNASAADAGGDYHGYQLQAGSPGHLQATDGRDVGVDFTLLDAALSGTSGGGAPTGGMPPGMVSM